MGSILSCFWKRNGHNVNHEDAHLQQDELEQYKRKFEQFQASENRYKVALKQTRDELEQYKRKFENFQARDELEQYKREFEQFQASENRYKVELKQTRDELEQYKRKFENFQASENRYKVELKQTRDELEQYKRKFENFQARMAYEASVDMGSSGALCEDLNNPCRETELKKMYDKLRLQMLSKYILAIKSKSKKDKTINEQKEKEKLKAKLQEVFTKAHHDMTKKKEDFLSFFQVDPKTEEGEKGEVKKTQHKNTKKMKYIELALQNLQMIIFHEEVRYAQTEQLGNSEPDPLCVLADECYKVGCLMALHNPPLLLDWENKGPSDYLPPIKIEETSLSSL